MKCYKNRHFLTLSNFFALCGTLFLLCWLTIIQTWSLGMRRLILELDRASCGTQKLLRSPRVVAHTFGSSQNTPIKCSHIWLSKFIGAQKWFCAVSEHDLGIKMCLHIQENCFRTISSSLDRFRMQISTHKGWVSAFLWESWWRECYKKGALPDLYELKFAFQSYRVSSKLFWNNSPECGDTFWYLNHFQRPHRTIFEPR